ncbi:MAG: PilW family protein [Gammaproteobacteria bacterium]|jgi:prepilin-type N-terminal cleavage/methylation domain-containing protein
MLNTRSTHHRHHRTAGHSVQGFTLIEMMVAMAIGLVLILGAVNIYAQGRQSFRTAETIARIQENARFALDLMGPDIRLADFWGRAGESAFVTVPGGITVTCNANNVTAWALDLANGIEAVDDGYTLPCPAFTGAQPNTDVLIVRHVSGQPTVPTAGVLQIQSGRVSAALFDDGALPGGGVPAPPLSATHDMVVNAYYVDQQSTLGANVPSLRRQTLVAGTGGGSTIQDQEIIPGVENLQVQFGVDTNEDGSVERYVDSDAAIITPGAPGFDPNAQILSVRLWMLVRAEQRENAHTDTGPYTPPDGDLANITPNDPFRRLPVTTTITLRNQRS